MFAKHTAAFGQMVSMTMRCGQMRISLASPVTLCSIPFELALCGGQPSIRSGMQYGSMESIAAEAASYESRCRIGFQARCYFVQPDRRASRLLSTAEGLVNQLPTTKR